MVRDIVGSREMESVCEIELDSETEEVGSFEEVAVSGTVEERVNEWSETVSEIVRSRERVDEFDKVAVKVAVSVTQSSILDAPR